MAARARTPRPDATEATPEAVDTRAAEIQSRIRRVNSLAVKNKITTADKPLVTTIDRFHEMQGTPIPTGCILIDLLFGGGLPRGCSSKWWGAEGTGKSMLAMSAAAQVLKRGGYVLWVLAEEGSPVEAAKVYGIDLNDPHFILVKVQGSGEHATEIILNFLLEGMLPTNLIDLVVIDSLAGLEPKGTLEKGLNFGEKGGGSNASVMPGDVARMYAQFFRRMHSTKALGTAHLMMISQLRNQISSYGDPEISVGGKATDHAARLVMKMSKPGGDGILMRGDIQIGHTVKVKVTKDGYRHRHQGHVLEYKVIYGKGIDNASSYFEILISMGLLIQVSSGRFILAPALLETLPEEMRPHVEKFHGEQKVRDSFAAVPGFLGAVKAYLDAHIANGGQVLVGEVDALPEFGDTDPLSEEEWNEIVQDEASTASTEGDSALSPDHLESSGIQ